MQNHLAILLELSLLEEKLFELLRILPDLTARREGMRNRGPHLRGQFHDLDKLCQSLEVELSEKLASLDRILTSIRWNGNPLPSANYPSLWSSWWRIVKAEAKLVSETNLVMLSKQSD